MSKFLKCLEWCGSWLDFKKSPWERALQVIMFPLVLSIAALFLSLLLLISLSILLLDVCLWPLTGLIAYICGYSYVPMMFSGENETRPPLQKIKG